MLIDNAVEIFYILTEFLFFSLLIIKMGVLKYLTIIAGLSISLFNSISFSFGYSKALLLDEHLKLHLFDELMTLLLYNIILYPL